MHDATVRRPAGYISLVDAAGRVLFEADTCQCPHCGMHYVRKPGSGIVRKYCHLCDAVTCGSLNCDTHMHIEQKFDLYEKGKLLELK